VEPRHAPPSSGPALDYETVIVGAGVSGIGTGIELLRHRLGSFVLLERAADLGGTWRENTYPGVAVDIPSVSYCFAFEMDYPWSRDYAPGAEILAYLKHCATKYGIDEHTRYGVHVERVQFDPATRTWTTHLAGGEQLRSRYVVAATGVLSQPKFPDIAGLATFRGKTMHTALWDHAHSLAGERVAVIGTGASAVQVVPSIATEVAQLTVFQRTPIWVGPKRDRPISDDDRASVRFSRVGLRLRRYLTELAFQIATYLVVQYTRHPRLMKRAEATMARYIRASIDDASLHDQLIPRYGLGCKRPAISNDYLLSFNRGNVHLVTAGIERVTETGIVTRDGVHHEFDTIILGTGFQTTEKGNIPRFPVIGLDGVELSEFWHRHRLQAFGGVSVPGYPNFFLTAAPYSGGFNWFTMLDATKIDGSPAMPEGKRQANTHPQPG